MSTYKRFCKNILKQYGKNIKAFEESDGTPSKETQAIWDRVLKETSKGYKGETRRGVNLAEHKPMVSIFSQRWGFPSREKNHVECYQDLVDIAEGRKTIK